MEITIFENITTESVLTELEAEGEKYNGLYVDMSNAPERKYVKDKAAEVKDLIKKVDAHRIADKKAYIVKVEKEAAQIIERLKTANEPFTLLIDAYTLERKKILDAEKEVVRLRAAMVQKEDDHEMGLLINKTYEFDKAEVLRLQAERDDAIAHQAELNAIKRLETIAAKKEQDEFLAENERLADTEYKGRVNSMALLDLVQCGITEEQAKAVVIAIAKKQITQITINY